MASSTPYAPSARMKRNGSIIVGLLVILILFVGFMFRIVGVGQVGVLTSFGQVQREVNSGAYVKLPWQSLVQFDIKTQKDQAEAAASSQDLQDVNITMVTNYHINPSQIDNLYRTVGIDYKARIIDPAIQESIKSTTSQYAIANLIVERSKVKDAALKALQARLGSRGIIVEDISLTNIGFSAEFTKAIEAKQVAQQQAEQAQFNVQKAQLDAQANAVQQAALTPEILQQQAIAKWDGHVPTALGTGTIFNLPLK